MTDERRSLHKTVAVYLSLVALLIGATYWALAFIILNLQAASDNQPRKATRLEEAVENARNIKRALATPILPSPPLPPIAATVSRTVAANATARPQRRLLPPEAADSYAQQTRQESFAGRGPEIYDRHAVR